MFQFAHMKSKYFLPTSALIYSGDDTFKFSSDQKIFQHPKFHKNIVIE